MRLVYAEYRRLQKIIARHRPLCYQAPFAGNPHKTLSQSNSSALLYLSRHLDLSKLYEDLPQSRLDFLKREILLDAELSFLTQYEDGWAVDVLVRKLYYERRKLMEQQQLVRGAQVGIPYSTTKFIAQHNISCSVSVVEGCVIVVLASLQNSA
ncbi:hypothetical protein BDR04DRAFT_342359 [Suillus decipiens]|nr:hypothetical protein BDR04DRAFT_342359 [Suillus decipiens]